MKPLNIVVDDYPGWTTSISPYRVTINGVSYRPMTAEEARQEVTAAIARELR